MAGGAAWASAVTGAGSRKFHGLCLGPYVDGQSPDSACCHTVSKEQLRERMSIVAPHTSWIRTYGMGNGLAQAGAIAHNLGLKMAAGAWLGRSEAANRREIDALIKAGLAGEVDLAVVGSETLLRGDLKIGTLCRYLERVRSALPNHIPVTTGEAHGQLAGNPEVIEAVDIVLGNIYPYWEGVAIEQAMASLADRYQQLVESASGKPVWIGEVGWPTAGEAIGGAEPTPGNAARFLRDVLDWSVPRSVPVFWFSAFDEKWKVKQEGAQGAHWGVWTSSGEPKREFAETVMGVRP